MKPPKATRIHTFVKPGNFRALDTMIAKPCTVRGDNDRSLEDKESGAEVRQHLQTDSNAPPLTHNLEADPQTVDEMGAFRDMIRRQYDCKQHPLNIASTMLNYKHQGMTIGIDLFSAFQSEDNSDMNIVVQFRKQPE